MAPPTAAASPAFFPSDSGHLRTSIFSLLESNFLFGSTDTLWKPGADAGKVRILSIDGGGGRPRDALFAAAALVKLEADLQSASGDADARIADFFDAGAGAGAGGVLALLTFARGMDGRPRFTAADALAVVARSVRCGRWTAGKGTPLMSVFQRDNSSNRKQFEKLFGGATLKDTVKPVLAACYDAHTSSPFMFSRADAVESESYDFYLSQVCAATCASGGAVSTRSVDGRTVVAALGGAAAGGNPTAAAITHVLHNKLEFPLAAGVENLFVVSVGTGEGGGAPASATPLRSPSAKEVARIAAEGVADMIDQAVAMAFGAGGGYVRIQAAAAGNAVEGMLLQRSVDAVLFGGRALSPETNSDKLRRAAAALVKEEERRRKFAGLALPPVIVKQAATVTPPRSSSASSGLTSSTRTSGTVESSPATPSTARRSSFFSRR